MQQVNLTDVVICRRVTGRKSQKKLLSDAMIAKDSSELRYLVPRGMFSRAPRLLLLPLSPYKRQVIYVALVGLLLPLPFSFAEPKEATTGKSDRKRPTRRYVRARHVV